MAYNKLTKEWREFFIDVAKGRVVYDHTARHPGYAPIENGCGYTVERYCGRLGTGYRIHLNNPISPGCHLVEYYLIPNGEKQWNQSLLS